MSTSSGEFSQEIKTQCCLSWYAVNNSKCLRLVFLQQQRNSHRIFRTVLGKQLHEELVAQDRINRHTSYLSGEHGIVLLDPLSVSLSINCHGNKLTDNNCDSLHCCMLGHNVECCIGSKVSATRLRHKVHMNMYFIVNISFFLMVPWRL